MKLWSIQTLSHRVTGWGQQRHISLTLHYLSFSTWNSSSFRSHTHVKFSWTPPRSTFHDCVLLSVWHVWWMMCCSSQHTASYWPQTHNDGDAQISIDPSDGPHTQPAVSLDCCELQPLELTELSPGLLQLLDLVLQEEHGHCESQQRQKLQLGRHHDSEQPHQIIQIGIWSVHAQRRRHWKHTHTLAVITKRLSVCTWPCLLRSACVDISHCSNPLVTSNAMWSCSAWQFNQANSRKQSVVKALEVFSKCRFVPPVCRGSGTSRCRLRPPCSAVLSQPVCTAHHRTTGRLYYYHPGHWMYRQSTIQLRLSIRRQLVDNHCLFKPDWTIFTNAPELRQQMSQFYLNGDNGRGEEEITSRPLNMPKHKECKKSYYIILVCAHICRHINITHKNEATHQSSDFFEKK